MQTRPEAARQLFSSGAEGADARAIASHAASVCQVLAVHVSRLIGDLGMQTLFARSLALSSTAFPCLKVSAAAHVGRNPYEVLRACLEQETPETATASAIHVFNVFTQLLERFIGAGLVASVLHEVWPAIFDSPDAKEP